MTVPAFISNYHQYKSSNRLPGHDILNTHDRHRCSLRSVLGAGSGLVSLPFHQVTVGHRPLVGQHGHGRQEVVVSVREGVPAAGRKVLLRLLALVGLAEVKEGGGGGALGPPSSSRPHTWKQP
jgi:hypothetical protein